MLVHNLPEGKADRWVYEIEVLITVRGYASRAPHKVPADIFAMPLATICQTKQNSRRNDNHPPGLFISPKQRKWKRLGTTLFSWLAMKHSTTLLSLMGATKTVILVCLHIYTNMPHSFAFRFVLL